MNDDLPEYLSLEHQKLVQDVNNAFMEVTLACHRENKGNGKKCWECGNAECFVVFEAKAELDGKTLKEYMDGWKKQHELDLKAAEAQTRRYEYMAKVRAHEERVKAEKLLKNEHYERNIFDKVA